MPLKLFAFFATLLCVSEQAFSQDKLVILSPHRKSIQEEFVPVFKKYYKETFKKDVDVDWIDQGGTSDDIRFLRAKFAKTPATSGVDIFWGGGTPTFVELDHDHLLQKFTPSAQILKEVPEACAGVPLYNKDKTWFASAISSFGIFYNKKILQMEKIPEPKTWDDLAGVKFKDRLSLADPRRSGTANTLNVIILQTHGWDKGWQTLTEIAGNTRAFTHSSSDPIKAIVSGEAAASMAIDFYALAKVGDLGPENLGFVVPEGQTILDPDPVAIVKGAPNAEVAGRFVNWVMGSSAQKLLVLPKGAPDGPVRESLGRMAINTKTYTETEGKRISPTNPFKAKAFFKFDLERAGKMKRSFDDLLGAIHIDTHAELKAAWAQIIKNGLKPADIAVFAKTPVTEAELVALADQWSNDVVRNQKINAWVEDARKRYQSLAGK